MRLLFAILLVCILAFVIESCREGCKDKSAVNYDPKATVENGTCMYCTSSASVDTGTYFFTTPNAPNPNVNSIEFILATTSSSVYGNGCQTEGKQVGSVCNSYLRMVNLTNETVTGSFSVGYDQNGFEIWFFNDNLSQGIGPRDTFNFGLVDTGCSNLTTGTMSPDLFDLQFN